MAQSKRTPDSGKGFRMILAIIILSLAQSVYYIIWDIVDDYSLLPDIISLIFAVAVGLFLIAGMEWARYLYIALGIYRGVFGVISLISWFEAIETQDPNWFSLIMIILNLVYYIGSAVLLLVSPDVKEYFAPEKVEE